MKAKRGFSSLLAEHGTDERTNGPRILLRLVRDEAGSIIVYMTLVMVILIGVAGLGTEGGWWLYNHQTLQNAADSAALSGAALLSKGLDAQLNDPTITNQTITNQVTTQATAVAAKYCSLTGNLSTCFNSQNNVTVTVTPTITGTPPSVAVAIAQLQTRLFSSIWLSGSQQISASAVAVLNNNTVPCILALAQNGQGIFTTFKNGKSTINNLNIQLQNCGMFSNSSGNSKGSYAIDIEGNNNVINVTSIGAVGTVFESGNNDPYVGPVPPTSGDLPLVDPYSARSLPATCSGTACTDQSALCSPQCGSNTNLLPGIYPKGIDLNSNNTTYTMGSGTYYLGGDFNASGQHTVLNANPTNGVTFVLMNNATSNANFNETSNNATLNITAPTSGTFAGIAIWAPAPPTPATPSGTIQLTAGNSDVANITGAVYAPDALVVYNGNTASNAANCTQIVAYQIQLGGNSGNLQGNCNLSGLAQFGRTVALVE